MTFPRSLAPSLAAAFVSILVAPRLANARPVYDVLCDSEVEIHSCHAEHPQGTALKFDDLRMKVNHFGSGTMIVTLTSGALIQSRRFRVLESSVLVGNDTIVPKDIRSIIYRATWPEWRTVAQMALGGAIFFGTVGLTIDGLQWVGGSGGDLGATSTGALVGATLFGGLGILVARERYEVLIQEGLEQRTVKSWLENPDAPEPGLKVTASAL